MNAAETQALQDITAILARVLPDDEVQSLAEDLHMLAAENVSAYDITKAWLADAPHD